MHMFVRLCVQMNNWQKERRGKGQADSERERRLESNCESIKEQE